MAEEPTIEQLQAALSEKEARIRELNSEAKGHRLNAGEEAKRREAAEAELQAAKAAHEKALAEATTKHGEELTKAQQRAVKADIRAAAKDAGANDPADVIAFLPPDKIKIGADGEIENAADLIADLKKSKPYLFGTPATSNPAKTPDPKPPAEKSAKDMTPDEYRAARAALTKRR